MNRRGFLKGLAAVPAVALATCKIGPEETEEEVLDLEPRPLRPSEIRGVGLFSNDCPGELIAYSEIGPPRVLQAGDHLHLEINLAVEPC